MFKEPADLRCSYDGLFAKAKLILKKNPFSGHVFLFVNKSRTSCKSLYYDGTGLVLLCKRLEKGVFTRVNPRFKKDIVLTQGEFSIYFEGGNLEKRFVESPVEIKKRAFIKKGCKVDADKSN